MDQCVLIGKFSRLVLRVAELAIHHHIEDTAGARDELGLYVKGLFEFCSQTDRSRFIVSGCAVGDRNIHVAVSFLDILMITAHLE